MSNASNPNSDLAYADTLWKSADALRGQVDAAEYKHVGTMLADSAGDPQPARAEDIAKHGYVLTPGRYVGAEEQEDDAEPFTKKYPRLLAKLEAHFAEGERLTAIVRERLKGVSDGK